MTAAAATAGQTTVRPRARRRTSGLLLELFGELADYEQLRDELHATEAQIVEALFGERPAAQALIAERDCQAGRLRAVLPDLLDLPGDRGIWLEDLFVLPEQRGAGVGRALLAAVAACVPETRRAPGVGGPRLERARARLLPRHRRAPDGRVDHRCGSTARRSRWLAAEAG